MRSTCAGWVPCFESPRNTVQICSIATTQIPNFNTDLVKTLSYTDVWYIWVCWPRSWSHNNCLLWAGLDSAAASWFWPSPIPRTNLTLISGVMIGIHRLIKRSKDWKTREHTCVLVSLLPVRHDTRCDDGLLAGPKPLTDPLASAAKLGGRFRLLFVGKVHPKKVRFLRFDLRMHLSFTEIEKSSWR